MKYLTMILVAGLLSTSIQAEPVCRVKVCNKIERFSLDPWSHIKDSMAETCFEVVLPKDQAVVGKVLSDESRWYQGSTMNPTKRSVTKVKEVYQCTSN
jgi:hypothetical protein